MNKIDALKQTIHNLLYGGMKYHWHDSNHCNCGVVAKTICNTNDLFSIGYTNSPRKNAVGVFSRDAYCITSDLPLPVVFQSLKDAGFTHQELLELEYLANKEICKNLGWERQKITRKNGEFYIREMATYDVKENLILYLKEWVRILEEETVVQQLTPEVREKIKYVAVSDTIREQVKEHCLS